METQSVITVLNKIIPNKSDNKNLVIELLLLIFKYFVLIDHYFHHVSQFLGSHAYLYIFRSKKSITRLSKKSITR